MTFTACKKEAPDVLESTVKDNIQNNSIGLRSNTPGNYSVTDGMICFSTLNDLNQTMNYLKNADSTTIANWRSEIGIETSAKAYEAFALQIETCTDAQQEQIVLNSFAGKLKYNQADSSFQALHIGLGEIQNISGEFKAGSSLFKEYQGNWIQILDGSTTKLATAMSTMESDSTNGITVRPLLRGGGCTSGCPQDAIDIQAVGSPQSHRIRVGYEIIDFTFNGPLINGGTGKFPIFHFRAFVVHHKRGLLGRWFGQSTRSNFRMNGSISHACNSPATSPLIFNVPNHVTHKTSFYQSVIAFSNSPVGILFPFDPCFCINSVFVRGSRTVSPNLEAQVSCN